MLNAKIDESYQIKSSMIFGLLICGLSILFITHREIILYNSKDYFRKPMTDSEKLEMIDLLEYFIKILNANKIEYFMNMGTLIGSVRHHGMVPWDDDIDICINEKHREKLFEIMLSARPDYKLYNSSDLLNSYGQWKFYKLKASRSFVHRSFKWPYIDIFLYGTNDSHIYHNALPTELTFQKKDIYPMVYRPYESLMLPAPCNFMEILKLVNLEQCKTRSFSHLFEIPLYNWWQRVIPCSELYSDFPFAFRELSAGGYEPYFKINKTAGTYQEVLMMKNRVISRSTVFQSQCSGQI